MVESFIICTHAQTFHLSAESCIICTHAQFVALSNLDQMLVFFGYFFLSECGCHAFLHRVALFKACFVNLSFLDMNYFGLLTGSVLHLNCRGTLNMSILCVGILPVILWLLLVRTQ